jgi:hypothetical protein
MKLSPDQEQKVDEMLAKVQELTGNQKKLDVDGDGEIEGSDLAKLRGDTKIEADESATILENKDHEVAMAQNLLDDIIKNATELKQKLGTEEKDIPAWIQDHISQSQNFISQANTNYHEHDTADNVPSPEETPRELNEAAPEGWEKTIKAMKKKKEIDNPWALANWMKKKGYTPKRIDETKRKTAAQRFRNRPGIKAAISNLEKAVEKNKAASDAFDTKYPEYAAKKQETPPKQASPWGRDPSSPKPPAPWPARKTPAADSSTVKVKNPETGEEILATTAIKDKNHPAHNAAVAALKKT